MCDKEKDTLEKIVEDAIAREQQINQEHPERHGYGMIEGEANDLIERIEILEFKLLQAQREKARTRKEKIRLIGRDKLYSISPEDYVIYKEEHTPIIEAEKKAFSSLPKRTQQIYALKEQGLTQEEIANRFGVHRSTISRELKRAVQSLKQELNGGGVR